MLFRSGLKALDGRFLKLEVVVGGELVWVLEGFGEVGVGDYVFVAEDGGDVWEGLIGEFLLDLGVDLGDCLLAIS